MQGNCVAGTSGSNGILWASALTTGENIGNCLAGAVPNGGFNLVGDFMWTNTSLQSVRLFILSDYADFTMKKQGPNSRELYGGIILEQVA
jgi:hypothetical protein